MVNSVAFSPDGKALASGSSDHTVRLWSLKTGQQLKTLATLKEKVYAVAFSNNGKFLASSTTRYSRQKVDLYVLDH